MNVFYPRIKLQAHFRDDSKVKNKQMKISKKKQAIKIGL